MANKRTATILFICGHQEVFVFFHCCFFSVEGWPDQMLTGGLETG
jgi:hypothetical protein